MPKILMLLQSEFPPDIRLEKEIKSLSQNGFEITLLCNQFVKNKLLEFPYCKIIYLKAFFNSVKLNKILNFPLFLNPRFIYYTIKTYRKIKPDFIHAHDLPMVPLALMLKFCFKKKIIFDMHENYPEALKVFDKKGILNHIFKNYHLAKVLENYCIKKSDIIISVVEENKDRLSKLGIPPEKLSVVSNTVDLKSFNLQNTTKVILTEFQNKFIVLYSGTVSPERGLLTAVKAVEYIKNEIPNLLILIIGDGKSVKSLQRFINNNNLENYIKLIPWVGHDKILNYIQIADICMIPQPSNDFINTTIPHKLFEYMSLGKTVLVSNAKPLKRIVEETKCGLFFISENPKDFSQKAIQLAKSELHLGENGRKAVVNKYNWFYDANKLVSMYQNLT